MSYKLKIHFHPGEHLQDELEARGILQKDFAKVLCISATELNLIIKGKKDINAKLAMRIGEALGTGAELWMSLQAKYNLWKLKQNKSEEKILNTIPQRMFSITGIRREPVYA